MLCYTESVSTQVPPSLRHQTNRCSEGDRAEAELAQLWDGYERALAYDREVGGCSKGMGVGWR